IISEVMFFAAFFEAHFYVRNMALPWLGGEGDTSSTNEFLWPGFTAEWPLMTTPDMAVNGDKAIVRGPAENMSFPGLAAMFAWLPFWNTVILLSSSVTVHIAHSAIKNNQRKAFNTWLGLTVVLGIRSEEHTSELQSRENLVCRLLLEEKNKDNHDAFK